MSDIRQFRKDIRTYLLAESAVSNLIGNRLYSVKAGQRETYPYVVMEILDGRDDLTHSGPCSLEELRVQFSIYGNNTDSTDDVRDAFYNRLCPTSGLNGTIGSSTKIAYCIIDNELDGHEQKNKKVSKIIDFRIKLNGPQ